MSRRTHLLVTMIALAVSIAIVSTGGVSSVATDRSVEVAVVDDSDAYLGIEQGTTEVDNETVGEITVTNQFPAGTSVEGMIEAHGNATVDGENTAIDGNGTASFDLEPGESASARFDCNESVTIDASGSGIETTLERSIECD